jgi:hypothetical protein
MFMLVLVTAGCRQERAAKESCVTKLKNIAAAKAIWEDEQIRGTNDVPSLTDLFGTNIVNPKKFMCPDGGTYAIGRAGEPPRCSLPMHSVDFGWVIVRDEAGAPVVGAQVTVLGKVIGAQPVETDERGAARTTSFPSSVAEDWALHATGVSASRSGYHSATSSLPATWPVRITLLKEKRSL